tara:strand:+ start:717 stop:1325 length:609 start_codon:yes stop_codon:yes gene_type:complete
MSTFKDYLTESTKSYDYKIKIAGEPKDIDKNALETALQKFDLSKMSAGKSTPIMTLPLDFPRLSNESVTIFDVTTNYPESPRVMQEYLSDILRIPLTHIVVKKPGEPSEQYQSEMQIAKTSEYKSKLQDIEYSDLAKIKPEDLHSTQANMSLLKELLKDRESKYTVEKGSDDKVQDIQSKEEVGTPSPLTKSTNPHPDPKRK